MAKPYESEKIPTAYIVLQRHSDKGGLKTVRDTLISHLKGANVKGVEVKVEGDRVNVYGNPLTIVLQSYADKQKGNKIPVRLVMSNPDSPPQDPELMKELEGKVGGLESENASLAGQVAQLARERDIKDRNYTNAQQELKASKENEDALRRKQADYVKGSKALEDKIRALESEREVIKGKILSEGSDARGLEATLTENEGRYLQTQENLVESEFYRVSEEIEKRAGMEESEEVKKAKQKLAERELYLEKHGEDAVLDLPEQVRRNLESEWAAAEETIKDYKAGIVPLEIPIRIAKASHGTILEIPVNPKTENPFGQELYSILLRYGASLNESRSKGSSEPIEGEGVNFATIGIRREPWIGEIREDLMKAYEEVCEKAGVTLNVFYTPYYSGKTLPGISTGIVAFDDSKPQLVSETPREKVLEMAKQKGISGITEFAKKCGMTQWPLDCILNKKVKRPREETKQRIASALGISVSELAEIVGW